MRWKRARLSLFIRALDRYLRRNPAARARWSTLDPEKWREDMRRAREIDIFRIRAKHGFK